MFLAAGRDHDAGNLGVGSLAKAHNVYPGPEGNGPIGKAAPRGVKLRDQHSTYIVNTHYPG